MFKNIKGAIFDLDGTILDSMKYFKDMSSVTMKRFRLDSPKGEDFYGLAIHEMAEVMRDKYGVTESVQEIVDYINATVENAFFELVLPKPGVENFLFALKEKGVKMCIATLTDRYLVEAALKRCNIREYFSEIFSCGEIGVGKSSPLVYDIALAHLGTPKEDTWVFEDSLYAATTAKKAGYNVVAIKDDSALKYEKEMRSLCDLYFDVYPSSIE